MRLRGGACITPEATRWSGRVFAQGRYSITGRLSSVRQLA
jgi:hypothetical protein